mgnify:CR=1 FL=1
MLCYNSLDYILQACQSFTAFAKEKPMKLHLVTSSNIKAVGYDEMEGDLIVQFHSGKKYVYRQVPPEVTAAFLGAKSMGIFFTREVRGKYATEKL